MGQFDRRNIVRNAASLAAAAHLLVAKEPIQAAEAQVDLSAAGSSVPTLQVVKPVAQPAIAVEPPRTHVPHRREIPVQAGPDPKPEVPSSISSETRKYLGLAALVLTIPYLAYIRDMKRDIKDGMSNCNKIACAIFMVNGALFATAQYLSGAGAAALLQVGLATNSLIVFCAAMKWGAPLRWGVDEKVCCALATIGVASIALLKLGGFAIFHDPKTTALVANFLAVSVSLIANRMMIRELLKDPVVSMVSNQMPSRAYVWGRLAPWVSTVGATIVSCLALSDLSWKTLVPQLTNVLVNVAAVSAVTIGLCKRVFPRPSVVMLLFKNRKN